MTSEHLFTQVAFSIGPLTISQSIVTTWCIMIALLIFSWLFTRNPAIQPKNGQVVLEGIFSAMYDAIDDVLPSHADLVYPFIATLWIFILISNLMGVIPGLHSPTADLSVTSALAIITFLSVHWFGIRAEGLKDYLTHYIRPTPLMLPFHLISEISRTLALAVRLFGNILSLELTTLIVVLIAGFLAPIPILMLHIIEAIIQAYIFGILALIYIAGGIQLQELRKQGELL